MRVRIKAGFYQGAVGTVLESLIVFGINWVRVQMIDARAIVLFRDNEIEEVS